MRTVTVRNLKIVVPEMKIMRTGTGKTVDYTEKAGTMNMGRLAVDNELARMKYCT